MATSSAQFSSEFSNPNLDVLITEEQIRDRIKELGALPDALFIIDVGYQKGAVQEATKLGIPVLFLMLGTLVCAIQAFVFTILSMVYLSLAIQDHEAHAEHH